jgi:hypothetical protein
VIRSRRRSRPPEGEDSVDDYSDDYGGRGSRLGEAQSFRPSVNREHKVMLPYDIGMSASNAYRNRLLCFLRPVKV